MTQVLADEFGRFAAGRSLQGHGHVGGPGIRSSVGRFGSAWRWASLRALPGRLCRIMRPCEWRYHQPVSPERISGPENALTPVFGRIHALKGHGPCQMCHSEDSKTRRGIRREEFGLSGTTRTRDFAVPSRLSGGSGGVSLVQATGLGTRRPTVPAVASQSARSSASWSWTPFLGDAGLGCRAARVSTSPDDFHQSVASFARLVRVDVLPDRNLGT